MKLVLSKGFKHPRGEEDSMEFSKNAGLDCYIQDVVKWVEDSLLFSRWNPPICILWVFMKFLLEGKLCSWEGPGRPAELCNEGLFRAFPLPRAVLRTKTTRICRAPKPCSLAVAHLFSACTFCLPLICISTSFRFVFALSPPCFSLHFPECCHSAGLVKHAALYSRPGPPCTHPTPRPSPQLNFYSSFI